MFKHRKLLSLLLALALLLSVTACSKDPEPVEEEEESEVELEEEPKIYINGLTDYQIIPSRIPKYTKKVNERYEQNSDTVGWLDVPGTKINDVVVCYTDPSDYNRYYERKNFLKEYSWNGIFYADFRTKFGDGSVDELSNNICIYGHTMNANKDGVMFAPMLYFMEEDFARQTPYIYFSTMQEDLAWEVFAVFYAKINLPYNRPDLPPDEFEQMIQECIDRSIYDYGIKVTGDDKVLTLSTCTYNVPGVGNNLSYPNDYRYVIMGKLVEKQNATKTEAEFTVNPSPKAP